jgi:hypothetical protein
MVTFTSPQYRYSVDIPGTWSTKPATEPWQGGDGIEPPAPPYVDVFRLEDSPIGASARVKAEAVLNDMTTEAWLAHWEKICAPRGRWFGSATPWMDATVAGVPARHLEWR